MDLKCWGGAWKLPSIDIDCLSVITYAGFAKAPINKVVALPKDTVTGSLPELIENELIYSKSFSIIGIFRRDGYNADFHLDQNQNADTLAYMSLIESKLRPAILYTFWMDAENYTKVTRPAYGKVCGFPWSLWYSYVERRRIHQYILQLRGNNMLNLGQIEKILFKEARDCLNVFERLLETNNYSFGNSPTTLDAILYGHLAILRRAPLVSAELQNHLNSCEKLKKFCGRMERFHPQFTESKNTATAPQKSPRKSNMILPLCVAAAAMVLYATTSGLLTERRSKLAQSINNFKATRNSQLESID